MLRITPVDGPSSGAEPWDVAVGQAGWSRTSNPAHIAVLSDWSAYILDVRERRLVFTTPAARIREDERDGLLLISDQSSIIAFGHDGVVWDSGRVALDDLKVVGFDGRGIVCTGYDGGELPTEIVLDPATGRRVDL